MFELLQQRDLSDGRARHAFLFAFQADLLHGHHLARGLVPSLVHHSIGSWENSGDPARSGEMVLMVALYCRDGEFISTTTLVSLFKEGKKNNTNLLQSSLFSSSPPFYPVNDHDRELIQSHMVLP